MLFLELLRARRQGKRRNGSRNLFFHRTRRSYERPLRWHLEVLEQRSLLSVAPLVPAQMYFLASGPHPEQLRLDAPTNVDAADTTNTENLKLGGGLGLNLTGAGYTVGVWEAGGRIRETHQEFGTRVTVVDGVATTAHATHVAGTIAASGVDPNAEGMATQVLLRSYDSANDLTEMSADANLMVASNHSYGLRTGWTVETTAFVNTQFGTSIATTSNNVDVWWADFSTVTEDPDFGKYDADARGLDEVLFDNPYLLSVWSAGNDRNDAYSNASTDNNYVAFFSADPGGIGFTVAGWYLAPAGGATPPPQPDGGATGFDTLSPDQTAKNSLVVGAVNDVTADPYTSADITISVFSSYGPTDDGRIKPDVVGNGVNLYSADDDSDTDYTTMSGTSMAAPNVTGTATLLIEHHENLFGFAPRSATTKGLLIHTASDAGNAGPDYSFGWGLVNAAAAAEFLTHVLSPLPKEVHAYQERTLGDGDVDTITIDVSSGAPFKVTLVWTDPEGAAHGSGVDDTTSVLVNDLDLEVIGPSGTFLPWTLDPLNPGNPAVRNARNSLDNVEQVLIDAPEHGTYTIRISHTGGLQGEAAQPYSVLYSARQLDADRFEPNNSVEKATVLGSLPAVTLRDLTIHTPDDVDYFRVTAHQTGKLIVNALFEHDAGDLTLEVRDGRDNLIASSASTTDNESLVIPVVAQEPYFVRVFGVDGAENCYALEIENFAAPIPDAVVLDPAHDTGASNSDNVTSVAVARIFIEADLADFAADGIDILDPVEVANDEPGAAVQVFVNGSAVGYATPIAGTGDTLFQYTFTAGQLSTALIPVGGGSLNFVKAAVRIFDGQRDAGGNPDPADGRTLLSEPLLLTLDTQIATPLTAPDLLATSDSGMFDDDNVTNIQAAAFQGTGEPNARVRVRANGILVGQGVINTDGTWEVTVEPLADGVYDMTFIQEDLAGNISSPSPALRIEIDTYAPNTAYLDLVEASDTGRHNDDNVTRDNTPDVTITTEDPNAGNHVLFTDNMKFRIFDRFEGQQEFLLYDSALDVPVDNTTTAGDGFTSLLQILTTLPAQYFALNGANLPAVTVAGVLGDGIHNLKLEVEDRAGNISADFLLDLLIDTVAPPVSILGIFPSSGDSGVAGDPATFTDRVTNDTSVGFVGWAEADSIVRLYVDAAADGAIGNAAEYRLTVALPYDGDEAFPDGQWTAAFLRNLNDPAWFPLDGVREVLVTAEDLAGNVNSVADGLGDAEQVLNIFIDTQGPQITAVDINNAGNPYELFDPKPSTSGPTPLVHSLVISVEDWPARSSLDANFLYEALFREVAENAANYSLVGDHNGPIAIDRVEFTTSPALADGQPAQGYLTIYFVDPLPDDRFTLTLSDNLVDPVGNALDGESNTGEPQETPDIQLPSGDGQPGGAFVARFTVDSRAEVAVWAAGSVYVDSNGNYVWDPDGKDGDYVNRDVTYVLGFTSDNVFAGNFAALVDDPLTLEDETEADGFHKLAAYGKLGSNYRWLIDVNNDGVPDLVVINPLALNGLPAAGNFDGDGTNGDEVALKVGTAWYLDANRDFTVDAAEQLPGNDMIGYPVVGDFDGDGIDDLGAWADDVFSLNLSTFGPIDGFTDVQFRFGMTSAFIGVLERPIAADFDGDGIDDLGLWVPKHSAGTPLAMGEWYILVSDRDAHPLGIRDRIRVNPQGGLPIVDFVPAPFGKDVFKVFGSDYALPVVGNFDPHNIQPQLGGVLYGLTNLDNPYDVDGDGAVTPLDVVMQINDYNLNGSRALTISPLGGPFWDVNGDGLFTPDDILAVVNYLNRQLSAGEGAEGESEAVYEALELPWVPAGANQAELEESLSVPSEAVRLVVSQADQYFSSPIGTAAEFGTGRRLAAPRCASIWDVAAEWEFEDLLSDITPAIAGS